MLPLPAKKTGGMGGGQMSMAPFFFRPCFDLLHCDVLLLLFMLQEWGPFIRLLCHFVLILSPLSTCVFDLLCNIKRSIDISQTLSYLFIYYTQRERHTHTDTWFIVKATYPYTKGGWGCNYVKTKTFIASTVHNISSYQQPQNLSSTYQLVLICLRNFFFSEL